MIKLKNICAGYDEMEVLHHIDAEFLRGKITVLLGPNGCGKSTLLKTLVRLNSQMSGCIEVNGKEMEAYAPTELAKQIAYLPQTRNVPDITALRMVLHGRFPYLSYPRRYGKTDFQKAREALRWVGIEEMAEENVSQLSGGNQQKVYIAMALAQDTPVILMDEPTTYLDISHQLKLMQIIKELADAGKTVILVMHDIAMALQIADEVVVMKAGRIQKCGTPSEVFASGVLDEVFEIKVGCIETESGLQYFYS